MYRLALQLRIFLPTEMTDFLSLSVYLKPEKGTTSRSPTPGLGRSCLKWLIGIFLFDFVVINV